MMSILSKIYSWLKSITSLMLIGDYIVVGFMLFMAAAMFMFTPWILGNRSGEIEIKSGPRTVGLFSLKNDALIDIKGAIGETRVAIKDGKAVIVDSPCANKYCKHMGPIGDSGGVLVCVPNEIIVGSVKQDRDGLDAVSK